MISLLAKLDKIVLLEEKYKNRISHLQQKITFYDKTGRGGACISLTGEIQAYNAVLKDLREINHE